MRRARLAGLEHESAFQHTTAGIAVIAGPAMDLQIHLHAFYLRDFVGALHGFFRIGEPPAITGSSPQNRLVWGAAVIDGDSFGRQHAGSVSRRLMEFQRLTAKSQRVAFFDNHVALRN